MGERIWPRSVEAFETSDREFHRSRDAAEAHQQRIDGARLATELLEGGMSLGESLRRGGFLSPGMLPELDEVFASTKLVISHWQCRDQAGYQPRRVNKDGYIFVHGDAGSWSGPRGSECSASEVVGYWTDTKRREAASRG